jgi:hypothetical protein
MLTLVYNRRAAGLAIFTSTPFGDARSVRKHYSDRRRLEKELEATGCNIRQNSDEDGGKRRQHGEEYGVATHLTSSEKNNHIRSVTTSTRPAAPLPWPQVSFVIQVARGQLVAEAFRRH